MTALHSDNTADPVAARLDAYLTRIAPFGFAGSVLVARQGHILLNKGYGMADRGRGIANTADTVHSLGSVTKQFTAAAIMKLESADRLSVDDPLSNYLGAVPEDKRGITLHHLLTHTAGAINYTGEDYEAIDRQTMVEKVMEAPLRFTPGEQYAYSNAGYSLLAAVVEIVSGQPYEAFLQGQLFEPAGMQSTGYRAPDWEGRIVAHWYVGDQDNQTALEKPYPYWNIMGNGEMLSTTNDMYKWHVALSGESVLSAAAKQKLYTPFLNNYAYGWEVLQTEHGRVVQHDGASELGSSATCRRFIDQDIVIVLLINQSVDGTPVCKLVEDKVAHLLFGGETDLPPVTISADRSRLERFTGRYELESGGRFHLTRVNDSLKARAEGQDAINLLSFNNVPISAYEQLNQRARELFQAAVSGNPGPFVAELDGDHARAERICLSIERQAIEAGVDKVREVIIEGSIPSFLPGAIATSVRLKGNAGHVGFYLHWQEGKLRGLSQAIVEESTALLFAPITAVDFAGYHLASANQVRFQFNVDKDGSARSLTVPHPTGEFIARRAPIS